MRRCTARMRPQGLTVPHGACADGESQRASGGSGSGEHPVAPEGGMERRLTDVAPGDSGTGGRSRNTDKAYDEAGLVAQLRALQITARGAVRRTAQQYRWAHDAPRWLSDQPAKAQKHRANLQLDQEHGPDAKGPSSQPGASPVKSLRWRSAPATWCARNAGAGRQISLGQCVRSTDKASKYLRKAWDKALVPDQKLMFMTFYSRKSFMHFSSPSLACATVLAGSEEFEEFRRFGEDRSFKSRLDLRRPFGRMRRGHRDSSALRFGKLCGRDRSDMQERRGHACQSVLGKILRSHLGRHFDDVQIAQRLLERRQAGDGLLAPGRCRRHSRRLLSSRTWARVSRRRPRLPP